MKNIFIFFWFLFPALHCYCQSKCSFIPDTLFIPSENKAYAGEKLEVALKDRSIVQLYKLKNNKYFLKLVVTQNLYFDKVDMLEIQSGSKSYYSKDTKQYQLDKASSFYVVEIFKNYLATLKDDGITAIVFGKVETDFTRQDAGLVRQISKCFYETIEKK